MLECHRWNVIGPFIVIIHTRGWLYTRTSIPAYYRVSVCVVSKRAKILSFSFVVVTAVFPLIRNESFFLSFFSFLKTKKKVNFFCSIGHTFCRVVVVFHLRRMGRTTHQQRWTNRRMDRIEKGPFFLFPQLSTLPYSTYFTNSLGIL